jgi:hypothetical protein
MDNAILKHDENMPTPAMDELVQYIEQGSKAHRGGDEYVSCSPSFALTLADPCELVAQFACNLAQRRL